MVCWCSRMVYITVYGMYIKQLMLVLQKKKKNTIMGMEGEGMGGMEDAGKVKRGAG